MFSYKREGSIVVVEGRIAPTAWGMTGTTVRAELPVMGISASMTGITVRWCTFIYTVRVTCIALDIRVSARKRESRVVVVEGHIAPPAGVMTGTTVRAELSVMLILRCVAGITIRRCTLENTVGMTGTALNRSMLT